MKEILIYVDRMVRHRHALDFNELLSALEGAKPKLAEVEIDRNRKDDARKMAKIANGRRIKPEKKPPCSVSTDTHDAKTHA